MVASYSVNPDAVTQAERLIDSRQYVLDSDWGQVQPRASDQNAYLERHSWQEYARWHLGLTDGATDETKARYAFVYGDFRRIHRMGIIACMYRAAEWRHKEIELAAHDLLQRLDRLLRPLRVGTIRSGNTGTGVGPVRSPNGRVFRCTITAMNPLSGVLGEAWQMYKAHARHLLTIAFVIYLAAAVIAALLALVGGSVGALLGSLVEIFAAFLLQATLVKAVQDVRDGRVDLSLGETVRAATPYLWAVAGASILAGIAITIGLILLIVPGLYLITIWAVIVPVIVLEQSGVMASFGRSQQLVRGRGWHVFGTLVLVLMILLAVNLILGLIFSALPHVLGRGLSSIISGTLIAPFIALVVTLVYYRLSADIQAPTAPGESYGGFGQTP